MPVEKPQLAGPIQLSFRSLEQIVVEPEDEARFLMTAREAARPSNPPQNDSELRDKFVALLSYVRAWCEAHGDDVSAAYAYPGDGQLNVLLLTPGDEYHFRFDDAVTDLDLDLAAKHGWLTTEVMQAPQTVKDGHHPPEKAIHVYGDVSSPREAGRE